MNLEDWIVSTGRKLEDVSELTIILLQELMDFKEIKNPPTLFDTPPPKRKKPITSNKTIDFLKELQDIKLTVSEDLTEYNELQKELEKDKEDGLLLLGEPFYIDLDKLYVVRYKEDIESNIKALAKDIIDNLYNQDIKLENVTYTKELTENTDVYFNIICMSYYGIRFNVRMQDVLCKLQKIPFE